MRMKHGSGRGDATSAKPRLLAAFTAVVMMFATAVPALMPKTAYAAGDVGGTCKPSTGSIGDITAKGTEDRGVATWVGRDMYIGDKPGDNQDGEVYLNGDMNSDAKPKGSYAVEAEGLTLVKGKLAINQVKNSWEFGGTYPGFRFGAVGFGGNFRPASGNTALAVAGRESLIKEMKSSPNANSDSVTVGAWTHGGWVGGAIKNNSRTEPYYTASLAGDKTWWVSQATNWNTSIGNNQNQVYGVSGDTVDSWGFWGRTSPFTLTYTSPTVPNGVTTDYLNYKNGEDFGATITSQSEQLSKLPQTTGATVESGTPTGEITRLRYNNGVEGTKIGVKINNDTNGEKVIKFTGDNDPSHTMQVFNIDAPLLSNEGAGVSFEFDKIPVISTYTSNGETHNVYASVVVNVNGKNVDFHNGWNFKWNGEDIGDGYVNGSKKATKYNDAASSIMWNFYNADKVSIRGGMIKADSAKWFSSNEAIHVRSSEPGYTDYITSDDPAAAMLGSIMVPKGSFDDHVTTNGRVWVGKDFMMNSPYVLKQNGQPWIPGDVTDNEKTPTASIITMDMERHNFGWSASINTACSVIAWNKVNQSGTALGGTSWGIYKTAAAAAKRATTFENGLIHYVTDDYMSVDQDSTTPGRIEVNNLEPEANYYIRELDTHNTQYELNPYIYKIEAGKSENENPDGNPYTQITAVYKVVNNNPVELEEGEDDQLTSSGAIINKSSGFDIEWGKTESGKTEGLPGSEWILSQGDNQWVVRDDGTPINSITIQQNGVAVSELTGVQGSTVTGLKAVIDPAEANQKVTWSVTPDGYADVIHQDNGAISVVLRNRPDSGQITVTATAADGTTASVKITVTAPQVKSVTVAPASASIQVGQTRQFTAVVKDTNDQELDMTPTWSVGDSAVAEISADGTVTGKAVGTTKIYADFGGQRGEATVTVTAAPAQQTRIYAAIPNEWTKPKLYAWLPDKTELLGSWGGKDMIKDDVRGSIGKAHWYYLDVPTTQGFYFIINNDSSVSLKTLNSDLVPAGGGEYDVTDVWMGKKPQVTKRSTRSAAAPRRMMALKAQSRASAGTKEAAWTHINTTGWTIENGQAKKDDNPATGKFKVSGLKPGTYYLQENVAPDGYFVNPTKYTITIASDGKVTWDPAFNGDYQWIEDVPTEFSWDKIDAGYSENDSDATNNPLAGSEWKLEKFDNGAYATNIEKIEDCQADAATGCKSSDKNHEAGKFTLKGLAIGKYRLSETKAPEGYKLPENVYYYFELSTQAPDDTSGVIWNKGTATSYDTTGSFTGASEASVNTNAAPNYRKTGNVDWNKVNSEDTGKLLPGSEWKVRFKAEGKDAFSDWYKVIDCTTTPAACSVPGKPDNQPVWTYDHHPVVGAFQLQNLEWGDYELVETKAPDGYYPSDQTYKFTVTKDNVDENINIQGAETGNKIPNTPGFELPETGGEGNTLIVMFGFALTAISMLGYAIAMRKRV